MTVRLTRTSHGGIPDLAVLTVDDDGNASYAQTSGHRIGRFARSLSGSERKALQRALTAASTASAPDAPAGPAQPSGTVEQLVADGLPDLVLDSGAAPPPGFRQLLRVLLRLRGDISDSPLAAIEVEVTGSPRAVRLRHLGSEPVRVRLSTMTVEATLFGPDSAIVESRSETVDGSAVDGTVEPGWVLPLVADAGIGEAAKGGFVTVSVGPAEVDALGDGVLRPAEFSWAGE